MKLIPRILVVLMVTMLVSLAILPLAQTDWAEGIRTSMTEHSSDERFEDPEELPGEIGFFVGLLGPTTFLLITGSITLGILNAARRHKKTLTAKKSERPD